MANTHDKPSRRAVLGALATLPVIAALPAPAQAEDDNPLRPAWREALANWQRVKAEGRAIDARYNAAAAAVEAETPDEEALDWRELHALTHSAHRMHILRVLDIEECWRAYLATEGRSWWAHPDERDKIVNRRRAALDGLADYRRQHNAACQRHNIEELSRLSDESGELECDAEERLLHTPAPDSPALLFKLERLFGPDAMDEEEGSTPAWSASYFAPVMADCRRLLAGEA